MASSEHTIRIKSEIDPEFKNFLESAKRIDKIIGSSKCRDKIWWLVKAFEFVVGITIILNCWRHW